jgi:hypothetical protein
MYNKLKDQKYSCDLIIESLKKLQNNLNDNYQRYFFIDGPGFFCFCFCSEF